MRGPRLLSASSLTEDEFNKFTPSLARAAEYWTPLAVARHAARRFADLGVRRVLDVGCGIGKFCLAAGAAEPSILWHGVERRPQLVDAALDLRDAFGLDNVSFTHGDALDRSWDEFDGFYFFNPFSENLAPDHLRFDANVELSVGQFLKDMCRTEARLRSVPPGTVLVTYHGVGGPIPANFEILSDESVGTGRLRSWRSTAAEDQPWLHVETNEGVYCALREEFRDATSAAVTAAESLKRLRLAVKR